MNSLSMFYNYIKFKDLKKYVENSLILLFKSISTFEKWTKINVQFSNSEKSLSKKCFCD